MKPAHIIPQGEFAVSRTAFFQAQRVPAVQMNVLDMAAPYPAAEKIGTFINNVMIDEFQDTSLMQWENFKKLLFEKLASGGKGLLVGDIKQSIYRWRNGDWKILYGIESERARMREAVEDLSAPCKP